MNFVVHKPPGVWQFVTATNRLRCGSVSTDACDCLLTMTEVTARGALVRCWPQASGPVCARLVGGRGSVGCAGGLSGGAGEALGHENGSAVKTGHSLRVRWSRARKQDGPRRRPRAERAGRAAELCSHGDEGDGPRQEGSPAPRPPPRRRGRAAGPAQQLRPGAGCEEAAS